MVDWGPEKKRKKKKKKKKKKVAHLKNPYHKVPGTPMYLDRMI